MRSYFASIVFILFWSCSTSQNRHHASFSEMEDVFVEAPDSIQTSVYWYWISDNISKEGVINDLHAMKAVGINRAFIGNIGLEKVPFGPVKVLSDEWWDILHTALKTAAALGIDIGMFNSPGWSQSGGPWVESAQAMRYLASRDTLVKGGAQFAGRLSGVSGEFQHVKTLAFKVPKDYGVTIADFNPSASPGAGSADVTNLFDGDPATEAKLPAGRQTILGFSVDDDFTARSLTVYPAARDMYFEGTLEVMEGGVFVPVKPFKVDRRNNMFNIGFDKHAPVVISFDAVKSKSFRLVINQVTGNAAIADIELARTPRVAYYKEKTLARMHSTPLMDWNSYQWERQAEPEEAGYTISLSDVVDLTGKVADDGRLQWDVPEGDWLILHTGMMPTGVTNAPASPEATGLEVDKMNHEHVAEHFDAFLGEILRRIPESDRKTFKVAVLDSYETGGQNWTDGFEDKFKASFGYDPTPYIPALYGHVVGSQDQSDRFLWDVRRFVADKIAYEYVAGLRDISRKHGLTIWLENYGHWGFPGEFLQYGGQADEIGGEFWSEGNLGDIENRAASSAAHIYGKVKVSAESFTSSGNSFGRYPALLKARGDRFFTEGINNSLLHVYIHQPYEDRKPGVNAWFGTEFNRFNTWYDDMDVFIDYLKRCNYMLQQGLYVADVAYFTGEDAPKMTGIQDPLLPAGHDFDYINGEVIQQRLTVKDGRFVLPDGMSYRVLALPQLKSMRPALLKKIAELVQAGGVVLGPKPTYSPSLADYGKADQEVQQLAAELWGNIDGKNVKIHRYGKGKVMDGMSLQEVFREIGVGPDLETGPHDSILYIHRTSSAGDIYFLSNQTAKPVRIHPSFRVNGYTPEWWDPVTGKTRDLPEFEQIGGRTSVPLQLDAHGSAFIVFRKEQPKEGGAAGRVNFPSPAQVVAVEGAWNVQFDTLRSGPEKPVVFDELTDWSAHPDPQITYYSGAATYQNTFTIDPLKAGSRVMLDLGKVHVLAKIEVNGKPMGGAWTAPYKVDITQAVRSGQNEVSVKVVNTWVNRLIGDQRRPEEDRKTWTYVNPYTATSPLRPSGLRGPVQLEIYDY